MHCIVRHSSRFTTASRNVLANMIYDYFRETPTSPSSGEPMRVGRSRVQLLHVYFDQAFEGWRANPEWAYAKSCEAFRIPNQIQHFVRSPIQCFAIGVRIHLPLHSRYVCVGNCASNECTLQFVLIPIRTECRTSSSKPIWQHERVQHCRFGKWVRSRLDAYEFAHILTSFECNLFNSSSDYDNEQRQTPHSMF